MKKLPTLLASLVLPGIGHILRSRIAVGVAFFFGVIVLLNILAYAAFRAVPAPSGRRAALLVGGLCLVWLGCQAHLAYLLYGVDPAKHTERKERAFHEVLQHYVRDELSRSFRNRRLLYRIEDVLRIEPFDHDAYFYLGLCLSKAGIYSRAIRCFKKCVEFDDERKWADDVAEEIARARAARKAKTKTG